MNLLLSHRPNESVRWILLLAAVPLFCAALLRIAVGGAPSFPDDDAYIALHSARHLGEAVDPSYPTARPMTGATSPIHVLLLRLLLIAGTPPLWTLEIMGWVGAAAYVAGAATLICRRVGTPIDRVLLMVVAVLVCYTPVQLANGLETGLAMAAVVWALNWVEDDAQRKVRIPVLAGLLPAIRPDLGIVTLALVWWRLRSAPKQMVRDSLITSAFIAGWLVFNWWSTDGLVPNTMMAKRNFFAVYGLSAEVTSMIVVGRLLSFGLATGPALVGLGYAASLRQERLLVAAFALTILAIATSASIALEHNFFRYLHPLAVPLVVAGLTAFVRAGTVSSSLAAAWPAVIGTALTWCLVTMPVNWQHYRAAQALASSQRAVAEWLAKNAVQPTVLLHDAGYLSEFSDAHLVDLVGLKTPAAQMWHALLTGPSVGQNRGDAIDRIACGARPDVFVTLEDWDSSYDLRADMQKNGWGFRKALATDPVQMPWGEDYYSIYRMTPSSRCGDRSTGE